MPSISNPLIILLSLLILTPLVAESGRPSVLVDRREEVAPTTATKSLAARLKLDDNATSSYCWESMFQLQACAGEVILFFLNGETYLGPACCHAIRTVQNECWPNLLSSLGYTAEEGDILEGYCDASATDDKHSTSATLSNDNN